MKSYLKFCLALGALAFAGCGDDDGGGTTVDAAIDAAATPDARPIDARVIDAAIPDARIIPPPATDAGMGQTMCGAQVCNQMTQKCCVQPNGAGGIMSMCVATADPCNGGGVASCDGTEDCTNNQVCCADFNAGTNMFMAQCKPYGQGANECSGNFNIATMSGSVVACNNAGDCPTDKPVCQRCTYQGQMLPSACNDSLINIPGIITCTMIP